MKHLNKRQVWLVNASKRLGMKMEHQFVRLFRPALNTNHLTSPDIFQLRKMETMILLKYQMLIEPSYSLTCIGMKLSLPKVPEEYRSGT